MRLTLPYPPSLNVYWRTFRGRQVIGAAGRAFKAEAAWKAAAAGIQPRGGPIAIALTLHPKQPKRARPGANVRCIDLDNCAKAALDALNGIAYGDDSQVVDLHIRRGEPVAGGALIVEVRSAA